MSKVDVPNANGWIFAQAIFVQGLNPSPETLGILILPATLPTRKSASCKGKTYITLI